MSESDLDLRREVARLADGVETALAVQLEDRRAREHEGQREFLDAHAGRRQPEHLSLADFFDGHRWLAGLFTVIVPPEFWFFDVNEVEVACPCGSQPRIGPGSLKACDGCERIFLYTGTAVHVYNPQKVDVAVS